MNALLYRAKARLEDGDPWSLSPKFTHRELYDAVSAIKGSSLMAQYLRANALDLSIDVSLNVLSALLSFGNPLLLKVTLELLPEAQRDSSGSARRFLYLLVLGIFVLNVGKGWIDNIQMWHSASPRQVTI
jgi:hypothetical protein